jgi:hypothetical protein
VLWCSLGIISWSIVSLSAIWFLKRNVLRMNHFMSSVTRFIYFAVKCDLFPLYWYFVWIIRTLVRCALLELSFFSKTWILYESSHEVLHAKMHYDFFKNIYIYILMILNERKLHRIIHTPEKRALMNFIRKD